MKIYTRRLAQHQALAPGAIDLFWPTNENVFIIRDAVMANQGATAGQLQLYVTSPGGANYTLLLEDAVPGSTALHFDGRQEILQGDLLRANSTCAAWSVIVTGYELTPP